MSAMTDILVKDDANPVVELTLKAITDNPTPFWQGAIPGVPFEGQPRLTVYPWEQLKSGDWKTVVKTEVPVMETLGASGTSAGYVAPPKVAYVNTISTTVYANKRSTQADRANLLKIHCGLLQGSSSVTATGILAQTTAADGWKNSVLPIPALIVNRVVPN